MFVEQGNTPYKNTKRVGVCNMEKGHKMSFKTKKFVFMRIQTAASCCVCVYTCVNEETALMGSCAPIRLSPDGVT